MDLSADVKPVIADNDDDEIIFVEERHRPDTTDPNSKKIAIDVKPQIDGDEDICVVAERRKSDEPGSSSKRCETHKKHNLKETFAKRPQKYGEAGSSNESRIRAIKKEIKSEPAEHDEGSILIQGTTYSPAQLYDLSESVPMENEGFMLKQRRFRFTIKEIVENSENMDNVLEQILEDIVRKSHSGETHIGFTLSHPDFNNPINIPLRDFDTFTGRMVLHEAANRLQSGGFLFKLTNRQMDLQVTLANNGPIASGNTEALIQAALQGANQRTWSRTLTKVPGEDLCLPKCVALGLAYVNYRLEEKNTQKSDDLRRKFENLARASKPRELNRRAMAILELAGLQGKHVDYTLEDIAKIQAVYQGYQLICFDQYMRILYEGPPVRNTDKVIGMLLHFNGTAGHFWHIKRINTMITRGYYCTHCKVSYKIAHDHYTCKLKCRSCGYTAPEGVSDPCVGDGMDVDFAPCPDCHRRFRTQFCFDKHKELGPNGGKSFCQFSKICTGCGQVKSGKSGRGHKCGHHYCHTCMTDRTPDHVCTMTRVGAPPESNEIQIAFDIETTLYRKEYKGVMYDYHLPCMLICLRSCLVCRDRVPTSVHDRPTCDRCGNEKTGNERIKVFQCFDVDLEKNTVVEDFLKWANKHKDATFIAHNLKGFDGQFLIEEIEKKQTKQRKPEVIMCGKKLMMLKIGSNRFIDSLNFLPMKLAAFSKAFNLGELKKGYFPHAFNRPENFSSPSGPLPDPCYYGLEMMGAVDRDVFLKWHTESVENRVVFDFQKDMLDYCFSDVVLLARGCNIFSATFFALTNVRVFEEATTIASAAMKVYRRNFAVEGKIAVTHPVTAGVAQSQLALTYLEWYGQRNGVHVQHKLNGGEMVVPGTRYKLDGFIHPTAETRGKAIEVNGCYFHLHSCKYGPQSTVNGETWKRVKTGHHLKRKAVEDVFDLDVTWECEIHKKLKKDPEMRRFFKTCKFQGPFDVSNAFFGGRTEVFTMRMMKTDADLHLAYFDFCSLYPWVNKYMAYPVGPHRDIHGSDGLLMPIERKEQLTIKGFIMCKVLPPPALRIPVLPFKAPGGLVFGLCYTCMMTSLNDTCTHTDEERALIGSWATPEICLALDKGYKILEVYSGMHWDEWWQYDASKALDDPTKHGPFSAYMDMFVKLKTEASGYPESTDTEERKLAYIEEFLAKEGIQLEKERIFKNADTRQVAKLLLNALWGKMGQRIDLTQTLYITSPAEFWRMLDDSEVEMISVKSLGPFMLRVTCKHGPEATRNVPNYRSVPYAALTTAYGRIRLYQALDMVAEGDLAYADTDSLVFRYRGAVNPVESLVGSALGELTDELKPGFKMTHFVAQGPKCYSYRLESDVGEEAFEVKCRGFRQTSEAVKSLNFEAIAKHVDQLAHDDDVIVYQVPYNMIERDNSHGVYNHRQIKNFGAMFSKRRIVSNYETLPFGYKVAI